MNPFSYTISFCSRYSTDYKTKIIFFFPIFTYLTISYNSLPQVFQIRSLRFIKVLLCSTWFEKFSSKLLFWEVVSCGKLVSFVNNSTTTLGPQIVRYIWVIQKSIHFSPSFRKNVFHLLKEEHEKNLCEKSWIVRNLLYITIMIRNCTKVDTYAYLLLDLFFWSLLEHLRKSLYCLYQAFFTTKFFARKNSCTKPKIAAFF